MTYIRPGTRVRITGPFAERSRCIPKLYPDCTFVGSEGTVSSVPDPIGDFHGGPIHDYCVKIPYKRADGTPDEAGGFFPLSSLEIIR